MTRTLFDGDIRCLPVVDEGDELVGIVSEADLLSREGHPKVRRLLAGLLARRIASHSRHWTIPKEGLTAGEIMTTGVICCHPKESVAAVTRRMVKSGVRTLPVIDDGRLVGVLSRRDLLFLLDRPDSEVRSRVAEVLANPLLVPEGHSVQAKIVEGVVTLSGAVRYRGDADDLCAIVGRVPGVIAVGGELTWEAPDPKPFFLRDTDWR